MTWPQSLVTRLIHPDELIPVLLKGNNLPVILCVTVDCDIDKRTKNTLKCFTFYFKIHLVTNISVNDKQVLNIFSKHIVSFL